MVCTETARRQGSVPGRSAVAAWPCSACAVLPEQPSTRAEIRPHSAAAPALTHPTNVGISQIATYCQKYGSLPEKNKCRKKTNEEPDDRNNGCYKGIVPHNQLSYYLSTILLFWVQSNVSKTVFVHTNSTAIFLLLCHANVMLQISISGSNKHRRICYTLMTSASLIRHGTASSRVQKRLISSTLSFPGEPVLSFLTSHNAHENNHYLLHNCCHKPASIQFCIIHKWNDDILTLYEYLLEPVKLT